ncbi:MAG: hypothetical protein ABEK59_10135 [Halobacteria archaeon]
MTGETQDMDGENGSDSLFILDNEEKLIDLDYIQVLFAGLVGAVAGGTMYLGAVADVYWIPSGFVFGLLSALFYGRRAPGPGRGMIWGLGISFLTGLFLFGIDHTITTVAFEFADSSDIFSNIVKITLGLGAPIGLAIGGINAVTKETGTEPIKLDRGIITGGLAGLIAGLIVQPWLEQYGIVGFTVNGNGLEGLLYHLLFTTAVGIMYGLLFQRDARGWGSSITWGFAYGFFWWTLGVLTLSPLLTGDPVLWNLPDGRGLISSFVGHGLYGLILGFIYSVFDHLWIIMFYESDPLHISVRGPGFANVQSLKWGSLSAIPGGIIYVALIWYVGRAEYISRIVGAQSTSVGIVVAMIIALIIGMIYGVLYRYESPNLGTAVLWGFVYGVIWWYVGILTLLPEIITGQATWTHQAIDIGMPLLIGQMIYGSLTAAIFYIFEYREKAWATVDPNAKATEEIRRRKVGTSAPAVWMYSLGMGVFVLLLLL